MNMTTQMHYARQGVCTTAMQQAAEFEQISIETLVTLIAQGKAVLPANRKHTSLIGRAVGHGLRTKINVNLGISEDASDYEREYTKVERAISLGADAIMDLSCYGDTSGFRRTITSMSPVMIGTVPVYDAMAKREYAIRELTVDDFFRSVEEHAEDGVDYMTIHAGVTTDVIQSLHRTQRLTGIVSRGGSIMADWMTVHGKENPFFADFDRLLDICLQYDITISLGDGLRPGSGADSCDAAQMKEVITLGELTLRAWERGVQVMIEGPGHVPLHEVASTMQVTKKLCHGAPLYVLGPLVTDCGAGYDHITAAIGGAVAAMSGADFLCYVTPTEHLALPDQHAMEEGIAASKIAAHAADVAKGIPSAIARDHAMSSARAALDWEGMFCHALFPEKARAIRCASMPEDTSVCTMCGELCAVKRSNAVFSS